jgi:hypothetical protein
MTKQSTTRGTVAGIFQASPCINYDECVGSRVRSDQVMANKWKYKLCLTRIEPSLAGICHYSKPGVAHIVPAEAQSGSRQVCLTYLQLVDNLTEVLGV